MKSRLYEQMSVKAITVSVMIIFSLLVIMPINSYGASDEDGQFNREPEWIIQSCTAWRIVE